MHKKNFNTAFTLAEILLSLSIIGIVAAIALPSLLGNVHERAFETQKKALYTRFSQAIPLLPSLNGYGQLEGTLSEGTEGEDGYVPQNVTVDTAAESFVRDGLSKVMKITNICAIPNGANDNEAAQALSDCGLPDKIIPMDGSSALSLAKFVSIGKYRSRFAGKKSISANNQIELEILDTKAAAFETVNGESILVHYNPNCQPDLKTKDYHFIQPYLCANFIYDLNGKKGPNTMGKDIGFITALYSTDSVVVAPNIYPKDLNNSVSTYDEAMENCKAIDENAKLPTMDEMISVIYNRPIAILNFSNYISTAILNERSYWLIGRGGEAHVVARTAEDFDMGARCVKR